MGTINKSANMYRQRKNGVYVKTVEAGQFAKDKMIKMDDGSTCHQDLPHAEYHPRVTHYRANNQRPAQKAHNIAIRSKH